MAVSVGEILARRELKKQSEDFYDPGQYKAVVLKDKALLTWVDPVGRLIMMACKKEETSEGVEEWLLIKPAHVISVGLNGQMEVMHFSPSYRFDEKQVNALEEALLKKQGKKPDKEQEKEGES